MPPVATTPADGPPAATGRPRSSRGAVLGVAVAALAAVVVVLGGALWLTRDAGGTEHRFVIPAGTAERIRAGEDVELIPAELDLDVGDSITLVNDDDVQHVTGFLTVWELCLVTSWQSCSFSSFVSSTDTNAVSCTLPCVSCFHTSSVTCSHPTGIT